MPVDIREGKLIRLALVPTLVHWLPAGRGNKPPHPRTVRRWALVGVVSRNGSVVKLETLPCGMGLATNEAALLRFFERQQKYEDPGPTPAKIQRMHEHAEKVLDAARI